MKTKRYPNFIYFLAIAIALAVFLSACASDAVLPAEAAGEAGISPSPAREETPAPTEDAFRLLGMIIDDDGTDGAYLTMYGFLQTAENLGYAAKLYRASAGNEALDAVEQAAEDGVDGLIVYSPNGANNAAVELASERGMAVAVPYHECSAAGLDLNIVADNAEYYDELARGLAERMSERSLKSGKILVYGRNTGEALAAFRASIEENYPQFIVVSLEREHEDAEAAKAALSEYILYNRDIKGMYVLDADSSAIAVEARSLATKRFRSEGAPSPSPTPNAPATPDPLATPDPYPTYSANPGILNQISITVFCSGLSDANYGLFEDNDIYALCIEPYYEASAQATMTLDRLMNGESAASVSRVNRPIVYNDTADKYKAIYDEMKRMFSLDDGA